MDHGYKSHKNLISHEASRILPKRRLVEAVLPLVRLCAGRQRGRGAGETAEVRDLTVSVATGKFGRSNNQQNENMKKTIGKKLPKKMGRIGKQIEKRLGKIKRNDEEVAKN